MHLLLLFIRLSPPSYVSTMGEGEAWALFFTGVSCGCYPEPNLAVEEHLLSVSSLLLPSPNRELKYVPLEHNLILSGTRTYTSPKKASPVPCSSFQREPQKEKGKYKPEETCLSVS